MTKKIVIGFAIFFLLLGGGLVIYYASLGGFSPVDIEQTTSEPKLLFGKKFEGLAKSDSLSAIFSEVGKLHKEGKIEGHLGGYFFNDPKNKNGVIKAFVGILVRDSSYTYPGFAYFPISSKNVLRAEVKAHRSVAPIVIYSAVYDYSEDHSIPLREEFLEWYESEDRMFVEIELKED